MKQFYIILVILGLMAFNVVAQVDTVKSNLVNSDNLNKIKKLTQIEELAKLNLYPNPVSDKLNILLPDKKSGNYKIYVLSSSAKIILTKKIYKGVGLHNLEMNVSNLKNGVYFVFIEFENKKSYSIKFVK